MRFLYILLNALLLYCTFKTLYDIILSIPDYVTVYVDCLHTSVPKTATTFQQYKTSRITHLLLYYCMNTHIL
jgi:hypothetical protein